MKLYMDIMGIHSLIPKGQPEIEKNKNWNAPPKTNIAPENRISQKETIVFEPSIFRGYVTFMEGTS